MTEPSKAINDLLKPQASGLAQLVPVCENALKFFLWCTTFIPFINSWLDRQYEQAFKRAANAPFKENDLAQLGIHSFVPAHYPQKILDKYKTKIAETYSNRMKRLLEAPNFSVCHSTLGPFSNNETCKAALKEAVTAFYTVPTVSNSSSTSLGKEGQKNPIPLSPDFLNACSEALPPPFKKAKRINLNASVSNENGTKELQTLIQKMDRLREIRFSSDFSKMDKSFFGLISHVRLTPPSGENNEKLPAQVQIEKIGQDLHLKISTTHFDKYVHELSHAFKNLREIHIEAGMQTKEEHDNLKKWIKTLKGSPTFNLPPDFFESGSAFSRDFFEPMTSLKLNAHTNQSQIILDGKTNKVIFSIPCEKVVTCLEIAPTHFQHFKTVDLSDLPVKEANQMPLDSIIQAIPSLSEICLAINAFPSCSERLKNHFLNQKKSLDCYIRPFMDHSLKSPCISIQRNHTVAMIETPFHSLANCLDTLKPYFEKVSQIHFPPKFLTNSVSTNDLIDHFKH